MLLGCFACLLVFLKLASSDVDSLVIYDVGNIFYWSMIVLLLGCSALLHFVGLYYLCYVIILVNTENDDYFSCSIMVLFY